MHQVIRQPLLVMTHVILYGFATALLSQFQPISSASAQQLTGTVSQPSSGIGTQKIDAQSSIRKPHRLIRKPQNAPIASVEPSPSGSSPVSSVPTPPPSLQSDNTTSLSKQPSSLSSSVGTAVPLATMSVAPSSATATGSLAAGTTPTGTSPLAATAGAGNSSNSGNGNAGGRTLRKLAAEMVLPPSATVVSVNPAIGTSPISLSFTAQQGGSNPPAQTLSISNTGGGTLSWSASDSMTWLSLSPASGTGAGTVTVSVTTGTLTAGSYNGTVILSASGASSVTVPVAFTVTTAPVPPAIGASPTNISFTAQAGVNPAGQTLSISNTGGGTLSWSASDNAAWLTLSPASGTGNGPVTLTVNTAALTAGSYSGLITLTATGATTVTVPVALTVTAAPVPPAIGASPTSLSFTAQQGGSNPAAQTLSISNTGGGTLSWSASDSITWLLLSPASGTGNGAVTLSVTTGTLTVGSYSGVVTLAATGTSPITVPVTFTVTAAPVPPAIGASPTSLSFTAQQGGSNPAAKTLSISNTGGGTLSWSASDNVAWLAVSPASGTGNGPVTLAVTTATLTAGSYSGLITLTGTGATTVTVPVTFAVTAAPVPPAIGASPTSLSFTAQQGGGNPIAQTLSISNTGGGTLNWSASPNNTWLAISPASGTGNGAGTISVTTGILTAGSYSGNITLSATGASSVTVPVTFTVTAAPTITLSPTSLTYTATQGGTSPASQTVALTTAGGTVNWTASDSASWLSVSPASGSGTSSTLTAAVNTTGLSAGTYNGTITVSATGASSKTVAVTLTVSTSATSSATLNWIGSSSSNVVSYRIYQSTTSGLYGAALATVPSGTVSYTVSGLQSGATYYFTVTAVDSAGNESVHSNEVSKTIP